MSQSLVNQITIDCLLNREAMGEHVMKQREKQIDKQDFQFYKKRILHLFEELISNDYTEDLSPDVKYAYDTFIKTSINYFKIVDNNDLLQEEYKDLDFLPELSDNENGNDSENLDISGNFMEADKLMMRSVKMDLPLDKYVKQSSNKTRDTNVILPKQREVDLMNPELKNKGIKDIEEKKNITIIYEDIQKPKKYKNV